MRAVAICAVLIALALDGADAAPVPAEVLWAIRADASAFAYQPNTGDAWNHQWSAYESFTAATRRLWLHGGVRTRATSAPGFSRPYREWGGVKIAVGAPVIPDLLYALAGGSYAWRPEPLPLSDSLSLSESLNGYSPLPEAAFLSVPCGLLGLWLRIPIGGGEASAGLDYHHPGKTNPFDTLSFSPAAFLSLRSEYRRRGRGARHAVRARFVYFREEETGSGVAAHREGPMLEAEYSLLGLGKQNSWEIAIGGAFKYGDRNRRLRLSVPLEASAGNDNLQGAWALFRWRPRASLWTGLRGRALYRVEDGETGHEARWECDWRPPLGGVWKRHEAEMTAHVLTAGFAGTTYRGAGLNISFSFRSLGAPD